MHPLNKGDMSDPDAAMRLFSRLGDLIDAVEEHIGGPADVGDVEARFGDLGKALVRAKNTIGSVRIHEQVFEVHLCRIPGGALATVIDQEPMDCCETLMTLPVLVRFVLQDGHAMEGEVSGIASASMREVSFGPSDGDDDGE